MKLIACNSNIPLARAIAENLEIKLCDSSIRNFSDKEIFVEINENIRGEDVFIIQSTSHPVNDHIMELLIAIDSWNQLSEGLLVPAKSARKMYSHMSVTGGKIKGLIDARDDTIYVLLDEVDKVASNLITEVNTTHAAGYDLSGNSSLNFFTGTGASSIAVNTTLISDPRRIQASAFADEPGDNTVAKQIAGLAEKAITALNNVTFGENYSNAVAQFGQAIANTETQLEAQQAVERLLLKQRDSISGVSIDEEVTNMMIYQRAFQASSRLISTIDTLLADVLNMKR